MRDVALIRSLTHELGNHDTGTRYLLTDHRPTPALVFTPDGHSLFSAGKEGIIRRIAADSDEVLGEWRASPDWIYSLAVSLDGKMLASGDWSGAVRRWSIGGKEVTPLNDGE